jgi:hypothetical protein
MSVVPAGVLKAAMPAPFAPQWFEDMVRSSGSFGALPAHCISTELAAYLEAMAVLARSHRGADVGMVIQPSDPGGWEWVDLKINSACQVSATMSAFVFTDDPDRHLPLPRGGSEHLLRAQDWILVLSYPDGSEPTTVGPESNLRIMSHRDINQADRILTWQRSFLSESPAEIASELICAAHLSYGIHSPRDWWVQGSVITSSASWFVDFRQVRAWLDLDPLSPALLPSASSMAQTAAGLGLNHLVDA